MTKPTTIEDYLAALPADQQAALAKLRQTIQAVAPQAQECISYGVPAFKQDGMLVSFGATAKHCAFYVMSGSLLEQFPEVVAKYDTSKGTIRFPADQPLPVTLVRKLVKARLAENNKRSAAKKK